MVDHAELLVEHLGENHAIRDFRKHTGWYMSGYPVGPEVRRRFSMVKTLMELEDIVAGLDPAARIVDGGERIKRGHTNGPIKVEPPGRVARRSPPRGTARRRHGARRRRRDGAVGRLMIDDPCRGPAGAGVGVTSRRELLRSVGLEFEVVPADIDESVRAGEMPVDYVASTVGREGGGRRGAVGADAIVVAADTTVDVDGQILDKPVDAADARRMLAPAVGTHPRRPHRRDRPRSSASGSGPEGRARGGRDGAVEFVTLTRRDLDWYVGTGEPFDKAGRLRDPGCRRRARRRLDGSVTNVIGLPLAETLDPPKSRGNRGR